MGGIFLHITVVFSFLILGFFSAATRADAKNILVNSAGDTAVCDLTTCTLPGALTAANTNAEVDLITFSPAVTHIALKNELALNSNDSLDEDVDVTISGQVTINAQKTGRVFSIAKNTHAILAGITITGGHLGVSSSLQGAGVYNQGILELSTVKIFNNTITHQSTKKITARGAGIFNAKGASLFIANSEIGPRNILDVESKSAHSQGAGIYSAGELSVSDSSIYNNYAFARAKLAANSVPQAEAQGAGAYLESSSASYFTNSTISSNRATAYGTAPESFAFANGGALYAGAYSHTYLANVTVAANSVKVPTAKYPEGNATGHAFFGVMVPKTIFKIKNSIITSLGKNCIYAVESNGYNVSSDASCFTANSGGQGDQLNVNPLLSPLGPNGGSTPTHALSPLSPAINSGNPSGCLDYAEKLLTTDQRGYIRPSKNCDSGAFELT